MREEGEVMELDDYPGVDAAENSLDQLGEDDGDYITLHELMTLLEGKQQ